MWSYALSAGALIVRGFWRPALRRFAGSPLSLPLVSSSPSSPWPTVGMVTSCVVGGDLSEISRAVRGDGLAAENAAGAGFRFRQAGGREIIGDTLALNVGGDVQQPQQKKERHHRGHEVGVSDFPCAAVMGGMARPFFFLRMMMIGLFGHRIVPLCLCAGAGNAAVASSTSAKLGPTSLNNALRAIFNRDRRRKSLQMREHSDLEALHIFGFGLENAP